LQNNIWEVTPLDLRYSRIHQFIKLTFLEQSEALPWSLASSTTTESRMRMLERHANKKGQVLIYLVEYLHSAHMTYWQNHMRQV
jgi:hypothetical protein